MRALPGEREHPAHVLLPMVAHVVAGDRHPSELRVEEAEQEARDRGLPCAARPDECDLAARIEPQVDAAEHRRLVVAVADGDVLEGNRCRAVGAAIGDAGSRTFGSASVSSSNR